jgi:hypothetical protein
MSAPGQEAGLGQAAQRLREIAELLASEDTDDAAAVELAREAAQIAADVGAAAADAARAAAGSDPG